MASSHGGRYDRPPPPPQSYAPPSAPALPDPYGYGQQQQQLRQYPPQPPDGSGYCSSFPPGTDPDAIRSLEMADRDWSRYIDEKELQQALCSMSYQRFSIRTVRLLMFLFKNPNDPLRLGPKEFAALWSCLGQWRAMFERFDRDRSGKIDLTELRDALYSLGYAIPPSVLQVLMSKYDDSSGRTCELNFDACIECGMITKGPTEKFKEKDPRYTGLAKLGYEEFVCMILFWCHMIDRQVLYFFGMQILDNKAQPRFITL